MSDLLSAAYDTFGHCAHCGSANVTPSTEPFHTSRKCVSGARLSQDPEWPTSEMLIAGAAEYLRQREAHESSATNIAAAVWMAMARVGARLPEGPWRVTHPTITSEEGEQYAGAVYEVTRKGRNKSGALFTSCDEAEAQAVCDALNRVASSLSQTEPKCSS